MTKKEPEGAFYSSLKKTPSRVSFFYLGSLVGEKYSISSKYAM